MTNGEKAALLFGVAAIGLLVAASDVHRGNVIEEALVRNGHSMLYRGVTRGSVYPSHKGLYHSAVLTPSASPECFIVHGFEPDGTKVKTWFGGPVTAFVCK